MLYRFKFRPSGQIFTFLVLCLTSAALSYSLDFQPRLRMNTESLGKGLIAGVFSAVLVIALNFFVLRIQKSKRHRASIKKTAEHFASVSVFSRFNIAIISGAGEELLFRAFIFGYIFQFIPGSLQLLCLGFFVNFLLTYTLYFRGKDHMSWTLLKAIECSFYALIYYVHTSLFMVAVAHAIGALIIHEILSRGSSLHQISCIK